MPVGTEKRLLRTQWAGALCSLRAGGGLTRNHPIGIMISDVQSPELWGICLLFIIQVVYGILLQQPKRTDRHWFVILVTTDMDPKSSSSSYSARTLNKWNVSQPQDGLSALAGKVTKLCAIIWDRILDMCWFGPQHPLFALCNHCLTIFQCSILGQVSIMTPHVSWSASSILVISFLMVTRHKSCPSQLKRFHSQPFVVIREAYFLFLCTGDKLMALEMWQLSCEYTSPEWGLRRAELRNPETEAPSQWNHLNLDQTIPEARAPSGFFSSVSKKNSFSFSSAGLS